MKRYTIHLVLIAVLSVLVSCASSKSSSTILNNTDISLYRYVVFGPSSTGDAELGDILLMVQNDLSGKLQVVSSEKALSLITLGEKVLSPKLNVKSELWEGGHSYITINLFDYDTNQSIAVIKSSGIGMSISQDQKLAYKAIKKELDKVFP